jgi:hypothetical protein
MRVVIAATVAVAVVAVILVLTLGRPAAAPASGQPQPHAASPAQARALADHACAVMGSVEAEITANAVASEIMTQLTDADTSATAAAHFDFTYYPLQSGIELVSSALQHDDAINGQLGIDMVRQQCADLRNATP